jgi:hypothetical protein
MIVSLKTLQQVARTRETFKNSSAKIGIGLNYRALKKTLSLNAYLGKTTKIEVLNREKSFGWC